MTMANSFPATRSPRFPDASTKAVWAAQQCLRASPYAALHRVRCIADSGDVVLRGCVPSFYLKQLAQELVRHSSGECGIINELIVESTRQ